MKTIEDGIIKFELQSPWYTYYGKLKALLGHDTDLSIGNIENTADHEYTIRIDSTNTEKIDALSKIFKTVIPMGNITLKIAFGVIDPSDVTANVGFPTIDDFKAGFNENPILDEILDIVAFGAHHVFVVFKKKVIQFYNDDITDPWGNFNGLAEDIARDLTVNVPGINFSTAINSDKK